LVKIVSQENIFEIDWYIMPRAARYK